MWHALTLVSLLLFPLSSSALYKCTDAGRTVYSDAPCAARQTAQTIAPAASPEPMQAQQAARKAALEKAEVDRLRNERERRQAQEASARARAEVGRLAHQKKCKQLEMKKRWSEEDAARADPKSQARARRTARRKAEQFELECGS